MHLAPNSWAIAITLLNFLASEFPRTSLPPLIITSMSLCLMLLGVSYDVERSSCPFSIIQLRPPDKTVLAVNYIAYIGTGVGTVKI